MILEFERADRMRDALDGVRLAVREVVARIDLPRRAGARMRRVQDAVEHRVAQIDVARCHVDLGAQHARAVRKLAGAHAAEQVEVFLHAAVAERAVLAGLGQRAAVDAHLLLRSGRRHRPCRRGSGPRPSRRAARNNPTRDRGARPSRSRASARRASMASIYSCSSLAGLVSSKRRLQWPPNSCGDAEIQADRLGVADMQIAVRLGRKAGHDLLVTRPASRSALTMSRMKSRPASAVAASRLPCRPSPCFLDPAIRPRCGGLWHDGPLGSMSIALTSLPRQL